MDDVIERFICFNYREILADMEVPNLFDILKALGTEETKEANADNPKEKCR